MSRNFWGRPLRLAARSAYNLVIQPPPPPNGGTTVWFSDARTATGTSDSALKDGGKWGNNLAGGPEKTLMSVIASTGLNFPTANVWQTNYITPRGSPYNYQLQTAFPNTSAYKPSTGQYWYLRFYYRSHAMLDLQQAHWWQCTSIASWELKHTGNGSTGSDFHLVTNSGAPYDDLLNYRVVLTQDTTYRVEIRLWRYNTSACKIAIRIYDSVGTLIGDNTSFLSYNNTSLLSDINPDIPVTDNDFLNFDMGNNDPGPDALTGNFYLGGVKILISDSAADWIGPYNSSTG